MDVTKIQKLNEMANQLKKHNIGYDTDSAINAAERIYGTENIKETPQTLNETDELRKELRKLTIGMQRMLQELQEIKKKQENLEKELNDAKLGIVRKAQKTLTNEAETREEKPKRDLNKPIDRNNVAPSEVSVEKFFYYGNK